MPFESKAQQRWMFANKPKMAQRWAKHTKNIKDLPEKKAEATMSVDPNWRPTPGKMSQIPDNFVETMKMLGVGVPTYVLSQVPPVAAQVAAIKSLLNENQKPVTKGQIKQLKNLMDVPKLEVKRDPFIRSSGGYYQTPTKGEALGSVHLGVKSPASIAAHEIGHGSGLRLKMGPTTTKLEGLARAIALSPLGSIPPMLASSILQKPRAEERSTLKEIAKGTGIGAGTSAVVGAPTLAEEARASLRGLSALKKMNLSPAELSSARKSLLKAFVTYLSGILRPGMAWGATIGGTSAVQSNSWYQRAQKE